MDNIIGEIPKTNTKKTIVSLTEFKGNKLINIREYFKSGNDWLPTKKGVMITTTKASELVSIFEKVEDEVKKG